MDLETAEVKRQKMVPAAAAETPVQGATTGTRSNLDRNKSKSVLSITARSGMAARGNSSLTKNVPLYSDT